MLKKIRWCTGTSSQLFRTQGFRYVLKIILLRTSLHPIAQYIIRIQGNRSKSILSAFRPKGHGFDSKDPKDCLRWSQREQTLEENHCFLACIGVPSCHVHRRRTYSLSRMERHTSKKQ